MCIGIPMQVQATDPGHASCAGRGETRRVRTALVGDVAVGGWLLVFIDNAQELLTAQRAQEINATLDLLHQALNGHELSHDTLDPTHTAFDLPSRWTTEQLRALSGAPSAPTTSTTESQA